MDGMALANGNEAWDTTARFEFEKREERYNHNIFRYPAKFHPPVAKALIERFSEPDQLLLDPFCGSGTLLVEALLAGRSVVGTDVDPLAVFITRAKTLRYDIPKLRLRGAAIAGVLHERRAKDEHDYGSFLYDIDNTTYTENLSDLNNIIPPIPNLSHWFRRRVTLQLANIVREIKKQCRTIQERTFFSLCFASVIRNASNADPVPVSGLEVTKHMRMREAAGRKIDTYDLMISAIERNLGATMAFVEARKDKHGTARVALADARELSPRGTGPIDTVITSPPYLSAVDYYRRHQLEMYWLGLVGSNEARLALLPRYVGRHSVSAGQLRAEAPAPIRSKLGRQWIRELGDRRPDRARALLHYASSMARVLDRMLDVVKKDGKVVLVIGDSQIQKEFFPTGKLISELAPRQLVLEKVLWYPLENRYMSYSRKNGANIKIENVLYFRHA